MLSILLGSMIGIHGLPLLQTAIAGQIRAKRAPTPSIFDHQRILLVAQPEELSEQDLFTVEEALSYTGAVYRVVDRVKVQQAIEYRHPQVLVILGWSPQTREWMRSIYHSPHGAQLRMLVVSRGPQSQEMREAVEAFESGAIAFFPQSLLPNALTAYVKELFSRISKDLPALIGEKASFCIDITACRVWIFNQEVHFPKLLFHLIHYLALHTDEVITNEQIAEVLFQRKSALISPASPTVHIYRMRKLLEQAGAGEWLETVRGFGYRFSPPQKIKNVIKASLQARTNFF